MGGPHHPGINRLYIGRTVASFRFAQMNEWINMVWGLGGISVWFIQPAVPMFQIVTLVVIAAAAFDGMYSFVLVSILCW